MKAVGRKPAWVPDEYFADNGLWNTLAMPVPCSTLGKCIEYLKRENDTLVHGQALWDPNDRIGKPYCRHIIRQSIIDQGWYQSYTENLRFGTSEYSRRIAVLNEIFKILRMENFLTGDQRFAWVSPTGSATLADIPSARQSSPSR